METQINSRVVIGFASLLGTPKLRDFMSIRIYVRKREKRHIWGEKNEVAIRDTQINRKTHGGTSKSF